MSLPKAAAVFCGLLAVIALPPVLVSNPAGYFSSFAASATTLTFQSAESSHFANDMYGKFYQYKGQTTNTTAGFSAGVAGQVTLVVDDIADTVSLRMDLSQSDAAGLPGMAGKAAQLSVTYTGGDVVLDGETGAFRLSSQFHTSLAQLRLFDDAGTVIDLQAFAASPQGGNYPGITSGPPLVLAHQLVDPALGLYDLRAYFITASGMANTFSAEFGVHTTLELVPPTSAEIPEPGPWMLLLSGLLLISLRRSRNVQNSSGTAALLPVRTTRPRV